MDTEIFQRLTRLEAEMSAQQSDVVLVRQDVASLRGDLREPLRLVDRHEQDLARLKARAGNAAVWLGVGSAILTALASLWLAVAQVRMQPSAEDLAKALAPKIAAAMHP